MPTDPIKHVVVLMLENHSLDQMLGAFRSVFLASLVCFGLYTAVKATYLSTVFATRIEERNLIYLAPLFFVGTAIWLERPRVRWLTLACATGFVAYLVVSTPYQLEFHLYSDI